MSRVARSRRWDGSRYGEEIKGAEMGAGNVAALVFLDWLAGTNNGWVAFLREISELPSELGVAEVVVRAKLGDEVKVSKLEGLFSLT